MKQRKMFWDVLSNLIPHEWSILNYSDDQPRSLHLTLRTISCLSGCRNVSHWYWQMSFSGRTPLTRMIIVYRAFFFLAFVVFIRVLQLMNLTDSQLSQRGSEKLELAILSFFEQFRKMYVGDQAQKTSKVKKKWVSLHSRHSKDTSLCYKFKRITSSRLT